MNAGYEDVSVSCEERRITYTCIPVSRHKSLMSHGILFMAYMLIC